MLTDNSRILDADDYELDECRCGDEGDYRIVVCPVHDADTPDNVPTEDLGPPPTQQEVDAYLAATDVIRGSKLLRLWVASLRAALTREQEKSARLEGAISDLQDQVRAQSSVLAQQDRDIAAMQRGLSNY